VDIVAFAGSFDMTEFAMFLQKKASKVKDDAVKKGLIKEEEWAAVVKSLTAEQ
jgi:polyhydroxyalkanoate synthesis regulator phasin